MVPLSHLGCAYVQPFGFTGPCTVCQLANKCSKLVLPLLCDITIYYSYLKMLHSYWVQPLPIRHVCGSVCPLFGVWHPYKYCLDHAYSAFRLLMVALEY